MRLKNLESLLKYNFLSKPKKIKADAMHRLFGDFSIADAMYAPVAFRFSSYQVKLPKLAKEYCYFLLSRPAMQELKVSACSEIEVITAGEVG